jgi:hypothetical protein
VAQEDRDMSLTTTTLGAEFARAFGAKDAGRIRALIHPRIDFRALTPNQFWEASGPDAVLSILFDDWLEESDEVLALEQLESDTVVDRERIGYRFSVRNPDGEFLVEQQAYVRERDGRIDWMRVVCSGFRPTQS